MAPFCFGTTYLRKNGVSFCASCTVLGGKAIFGNKSGEGVNLDSLSESPRQTRARDATTETCAELAANVQCTQNMLFKK